METIKILRENEELADILDAICDVYILPELHSPQNEGGHLTYNIKGETFAKSGSGDEYILLEDGSVGLWSSEGEGGRIADSLEDFFTLMINCPFWLDYLQAKHYKNKESLCKFAKQLFDEHSEMAEEDLEINLHEAQSSLAAALNIPLYEDVSDILLKFYQCANREPRFISTYTEDDGTSHSNTGSLF